MENELLHDLPHPGFIHQHPIAIDPTLYMSSTAFFHSGHSPVVTCDSVLSTMQETPLNNMYMAAENSLECSSTMPAPSNALNLQNAQFTEFPHFVSCPNGSFVSVDSSNLTDLRAPSSVECCSNLGPSLLPKFSYGTGFLGSVKDPSPNTESLWGFSPSRELSLSLGTREASVVDTTSVPDQCSEAGCSVGTHIASVDSTEMSAFNHSLHGPMSELLKETRIPSNDDFSLSGSRYLNVAQQILSELDNYVPRELTVSDDSVGRGTNVSSCSDRPPFRVAEIECGDRLSSQRCVETNNLKAELQTMLQLVDDKYNNCLVMVQHVISAFNQATNSPDKCIRPRFVLHSVSNLYEGLRERIARTIMSIEKISSLGSHLEEKPKSFESSLALKQWSLPRPMKTDQHCWKPQRGLPEKSVLVLRQWMFQNFLHPYPNDNEKQFLAIKSGLSRSQVSNWFINARVRLWKPMIEEVYELSKRNK